MPEYTNEHFNNRELSWLDFNERVLEEAMDERNPLMERLKFLAIFSSNLDEFYMVRVGGLKDEVLAGFNRPEDKTGLTPKQQIKSISVRAQELVETQYATYKKITKQLSNQHVRFLRTKHLNKTQQDFVKEYFRTHVFPVLTPIAVDAYRPFPMLLSKSLNIAVEIASNGERKKRLALVQVPSVLPRYLELPTDDEEHTDLILLEDLIIQYIDSLFKGFVVESTMPFRITRNADMPFHEEGSRDVLKQIEKELKKRRYGVAIRLEVQQRSLRKELLFMLQDVLDLHDRDIFIVDGPIDLTFLFGIYNQIGMEYDDMINETLIPFIPEGLESGKDLFQSIAKQDYLLHHPYHSFDPIVRFIVQAAKDPNVLAIKQTLYRVSGDSPIIKALTDAAESGKQVTVLVELKARFDEEKNIQWAKQLEKAGAHVIYGYKELKTHSKITLVVRILEGGVLQRFIHLGTGNYNDSTAKLYTDIGLLTTNEQLAEDATNFFNWLSGYGERPSWHQFETSPDDMKDFFLNKIDEEIKLHEKYGNGRIVAKMNSITDRAIITKLYDASSAGVKIDLIVRGICCLRPGIKGVSENIKVISIIDRYLEHSRIFYFYQNGKEDLYCSSADWMTRNMKKRIEILFPILNASHKTYIKDMMALQLVDNVKARRQRSDGRYVYVKRETNEEEIQSQIIIHQYTGGRWNNIPSVFEREPSNWAEREVLRLRAENEKMTDD
ncbi:RNA degradosome polyphosphate kinase [Exiguobacterium profundum]|uniref:Polyphosphate kinase n=1 Tax=Exiguobacterium profundum TaxID=307643 RepID=A0ABY8B645_9BACL|nr:RNA degradosome polyphosphate kinase [Exiguobacterium profundum]WED56402.1 RNA degradosome polyphosphate kinase [Exiguobacterium profundum]